VIVDDGSTDDTAQLASALIEGDDRFTLVSQANGGVASARNLGLANLGETVRWVSFPDSDDRLHPDALAGREFWCHHIFDYGIHWSGNACSQPGARDCEVVAGVQRISGQRALAIVRKYKTCYVLIRDLLTRRSSSGAVLHALDTSRSTGADDAILPAATITSTSRD
jgi:glycosyltransferase involved in cell wall biosynthesis